MAPKKDKAPGWTALSLWREKKNAILMLIAFWGITFLFLSWDWISVWGTSLKVGEKAPYDIVAPKDAEIVDEEATNKLRKEAASRIKKVFVMDKQITRDVLEELSAKLSSLEDLLPEQKDFIFKLVKKSFENGVSPEELPLFVNRVLKSASELAVPNPVIAKLKKVLAGTLKPNLIFDKEETERQKQLLMKEIKPVVIEVQRGELIARKGEVLKRKHILILKSLGFLGEGLFLKILAIAVLSALLVWISFVYMDEWYPEKLRDRGFILFLLTSSSAILLAAKLLTPISPALVPIGIISLSYAVLVNPRFGIFMTMVVAFALSFFREAGLVPLALGLFGGLIGIKYVRSIRHRGAFIKAGIFMSLANSASLAAVGMFLNFPPKELFLSIFYGFLNGVGSSILVMGGLPYVENFFNLFSPLRLLELADPSHPLLRRLQVEAPGTYHHSLLVANLAEAAAEVVGADPLLARVGSYYHDIGKIRRPHLFVENQIDQDNYHERITPNLSLLVIISHVKDGIELAKEYRLPQPIIDIIAQHHGTTIVSYFYHRAKEERGEDVNPDDFRYPGPKPQTKEAAIVMLADSVEAAARLIKEPNPSKIESLVREIVRAKIEDGQLSESPLSFRDVEKVIGAFSKVLRGMYHSRIEYPEGGKEVEGSNKRSKEVAKESRAETERNKGNSS